MEPNEIWPQVFNTVRQSLPVPTVWLAMQAARPLTLDGNYFVVALSGQDEYLAGHLQDNRASTAIEEALSTVTGRILAFRLAEGGTLAGWEAQKAREAAAAPAPPPEQSTPIFSVPHATLKAAAPPPPPADAPQTAPARVVSPTWEKLNERLSQGYKSAPFIKYPHGQAQYVLTAVKMISDTMDVMMPPPGAPRDDAQERMLSRTIERLKGIVDLDPIFLSLELLRYRESQGKNTDIVI